MGQNTLVGRTLLPKGCGPVSCHGSVLWPVDPPSRQPFLPNGSFHPPPHSFLSHGMDYTLSSQNAPVVTPRDGGLQQYER